MRPTLLDLFCCAGGGAMGYHRAGFDVVGVDIEPQPHYPFEFIQADAMTFPLAGFDAYHASPPCQLYSRTATFHQHIERPDLLAPTRERLRKLGLPYVIENVVGAPMDGTLMLCGGMFGLKTYRHRYFETNWPFPLVMHPPHGSKVNGVDFFTIAGHSGGARKGVPVGTMEQWSTAMGIDWMNVNEIAEAIPPPYTEWIGERLLAYMREEQLL